MEQEKETGRFSSSSTLRRSALLTMLVLGGVGFAFSLGNGAIPFAGWVTPALLLAYSRCMSGVIGFLSIAVVTAVASHFAFQGMLPGGDGESVAMAVSAGLATAIVYWIDRVTVPHLPRFAGTLVLPSVSVSLLYLSAIAAPFGTWGNDAYTQGDWPIVARFASLFGLWGVAFLPYWCASVIVTRARHRDTTTAVFVFGVVMALVIGHGVNNDTRWAGKKSTVRAAMTATEIDGLPDHECDAQDLVCKQQALDEAINRPLFSISADAVAEGAKLVAWHEGAGLAYETYAEPLLAQARQFAVSNRVYLAAAVGILPDTFPRGLIENKVVLISPEGKMSDPYFKAQPVPGEPVVRGDGAPIVVETVFGRVGLLICFDADFTSHARAAANAGAELLVIPSNDWRAITPLHGEMTRFRAIENGVTVLRPASNGLAVAYDETGNEQVRLNAFEGPKNYVVFDLTLGSRSTLQRTLGDGFSAFVWAVLGGLLTFAGVRFVLTRRKRHSAAK